MKKIYLLSLGLILFSISIYSQGEFILTVQLPSGVTSTNFSITASASVDYTWETIPPGTSGSGTFTIINGGQNQITSLPDGALIRFLISPTNLNRITASTSVKPYYHTLEQWGTANWTSMQSMFSSATNLTITATDVPNLTNCTTMQSMFGSYPNSTVPMINTWNTSSVTNMQSLFDNSSFNDDISNWDVSNVTNFSTMFRHNYSFNQDISNWDVSNATTMHQMFASATTIPVPFNQDISGWNVSNVTDMSYMFQYCSIDQDLGAWDMSNVTNANTMFTGSGMSTANYDNTLIGWSTQTLQNGVDLGASFLTYCNGEAARNQIINNFGWNITGDQLDCSSQCTVNIPDANFKAYLVGNTSINTNSDAEIQCSEASAFAGAIYVNNLSIADLTGIEAFVNITELVCSSNLLTSLDVTANTELTRLEASANLGLTNVTLGTHNNMEELNLQNCYALTTINYTSIPNLLYLYVYKTEVSSFNFNDFPALNELYFGETDITSIDLTNCTDLYEVWCKGNLSLTSLNLANGNNTQMTGFSSAQGLDATNCPLLTCIQVDDVAWSNANWTNIDAGASFSNDCGTFNGLDENSELEAISVFPNPTNGIVTINATKRSSLVIYNVVGEMILNTTIYEGDNKIDISEFPKGVYVIKLGTHLKTERIIKN
ncbi:MAG: BspA family leucine-rich repeat surface protein [Flavobacteriales bacterium]|nr:BspA family leucine-rich repeat surface protein [Flavobacteriales bacterium]